MLKKTIGKKFYVNGIIISLLILHFIIIVSASWNKSATYDEAVDISSGYIYWKTGEFHVNKDHLTFWKLFVSTPLLLLKLNIPDDLNKYEHEIGNKFLYNNKVSADTILHITRAMNALGVIVLGFFIFRFSLLLWGYYGAFLSLMFYILCPNVSAWAGIVSTDFGLTILVFLTTYTYFLYLKKPSKADLILTGILFGLSQATKASALLLYPIFIILGLYWIVKNNNTKPKSLEYKKILFSIFYIFGIGFITLILTYGLFSFPYYFKSVQQIFWRYKSG